MEKQEITFKEITELYPKVSNGKKYSQAENVEPFVKEIIELWFEIYKGLSFFDFPQIQKWELKKDPVRIIFYTL